MSPRDDNQQEMPIHLRAADADDTPDVIAELLHDDVVRAAGYSDDAEIGALLHELRSLALSTTPRASLQLQSLFGAVSADGDLGLATPLQRHRASRRRKAILGVALAGTLTLAGGGVAAATDKLPAGAQRVVSRVVNDFTPFTIADPDRGRHSPQPPASLFPTVADPSRGPTGGAGESAGNNAGNNGGSEDSPRPGPTAKPGSEESGQGTIGRSGGSVGAGGDASEPGPPARLTVAIPGAGPTPAGGAQVAPAEPTEGPKSSSSSPYPAPPPYQAPPRYPSPPTSAPSTSAPQPSEPDN